MSRKTEPSIDELIGKGIGDLSDDAAIARTGILIDLAGDVKRNHGLAAAVEWCEQLEKRSLSESDQALVAYFRANAWAHRQPVRHRENVAKWDWDQPELFQEVLALRRAAHLPGYDTLHPVRRCQIQTNLGNHLSTIGRFVEALPAWNRALNINPHFGMALGNRGSGLFRYASGLYDKEQARVIFALAHRDLSASLTSQASYEGYRQDAATRIFALTKTEIEKRIDVKKSRPSASPG